VLAVPAFVLFIRPEIDISEKSIKFSLKKDAIKNLKEANNKGKALQSGAPDIKKTLNTIQGNIQIDYTSYRLLLEEKTLNFSRFLKKVASFQD
jgi:hypothetical protein